MNPTSPTTAMQYHEKTSYRRNAMGGQGMDWENQPFPFKVYSGEPFSLPREAALPQELLSGILTENPSGRQSKSTPAVETLGRVLRLTYSVTAKSGYPGGEVYYRSVASAGALYPTEIYLAAREVTGLGNGIYHYSVAHHGLAVLRGGDFQEVLGELLSPPMQGLPNMAFFLSAIFFRSAWKYHDRSYRYHLLDTGHVLENLILALTCFGLPARFTFDFDDERVNRLLGFDTGKEVCLAISHGTTERSSRNGAIEKMEELPASFQTASIMSRQERVYPAVSEMHAAGTTIVRPRKPAAPMVQSLGPIPKTWNRIEPVEEWPGALSYAESVMSRRSRRNFVREPIPSFRGEALIQSLCTPDFDAAAGLSGYAESVGVGFLARGVEGIETGFHLIDHNNGLIASVKPGDHIPAMTSISLDQQWLGNAAFHFLFLTNLELLDKQWGPRGYRYAMITAGRLGERLYLVSTALGLGCCGIGALYDYEAQELLDLNKSSRLLYLVAVGNVKGER